MMALDTNVGTHAHQLRGKHKAILEDVLGNNGTAVGKAESTIICACMSVGKPGNGSVWMSTG